MGFAARQTAPVHEHDRYRAIVRNDRRATSRFKIMRTAVPNVTRGVTRLWIVHASPYLGSTGCQPVVAGIPVGNIVGYAIPGRNISRSRQAAEICRLAACAPQYAKTRYPTGLTDSAATCSSIAGSLRRRCKSCTICSTKAACGRAKTNKYLGPFPASGKMTRFSARNFGSRVTFSPSRSIARATGRPPFRATKMSLRGSSFVATRAPNKFGGIRQPRPLTHGAAHAIVSPRTFSLPKTGASRAGSADGNFTGTSRSAGPFSFLQASHIFTFIARKILGAK